MGTVEDPQLKDLNKRDQHLAAGLMLAVHVESAFRLYAYKINDSQVFLDELDRLIQFYMKNNPNYVQSSSTDSADPSDAT